MFLFNLKVVFFLNQWSVEENGKIVINKVEMRVFERKRKCWSITKHRDIDDSCDLFSPELTRRAASRTDEDN